MQLSLQEEFWLRVAAIAIPTLAALVVPFITYHWITRKMAEYQTRLNRDLEDYKKNISKELENHKLQLQSSFQAKFHEFQTRYSLLHQKRAEAIEKLFERLARVHNDLQVWGNWDVITTHVPKEEFYKKTREDFNLLIDFYDEKRIYFDEEIGKYVLAIVRATEQILNNHDPIEYLRKSNPLLASQMQNNAIVIRAQTIDPMMDHLVKKFKQLLSAENPYS